MINGNKKAVKLKITASNEKYLNYQLTSSPLLIFSIMVSLTYHKWTSPIPGTSMVLK